MHYNTNERRGVCCECSAGPVLPNALQSRFYTDSIVERRSDVEVECHVLRIVRVPGAAVKVYHVADLGTASVDIPVVSIKRRLISKNRDQYRTRCQSELVTYSPQGRIYPCFGRSLFWFPSKTDQSRSTTLLTAHTRFPSQNLLPGPLIDGIVNGHYTAHIARSGFMVLPLHRIEELLFGGVYPVPILILLVRAL